MRQQIQLTRKLKKKIIKNILRNKKNNQTIFISSHTKSIKNYCDVWCNHGISPTLIDSRIWLWWSTCNTRWTHRTIHRGNLLSCLSSVPLGRPRCYKFDALDILSPRGGRIRRLCRIMPSSRCETCKKKLGAMEYPCKCGKVFCISHLAPEEHTCTYDYRTEKQALLKKQLEVGPLSTKVTPI